MHKIGGNKAKYAVHWETQPKTLIKQFCSLMEHQSLVDVLICCGNNSIQAHKFVLAANSPYFREEFEKNPTVEQILVSGCEFAVIKNVLELMYCGYTMVVEDSVKYLVALIKLFQMNCLEGLFGDHLQNEESILIPKPQFLTKKPKYPSQTYASQSHTNTSVGIVQSRSTKAPTLIQPSNAIGNNPPIPNGGSTNAAQAQKQSKPNVQGRKKLRMQAEQACVKEAQASRMALANLQKEISASPQVNSFIIEDTCTETTVENFIPHSDSKQQNFVQLLNYPTDGAGFIPLPPIVHGGTAPAQSSSFNGAPSTAHVKDKLKNILGPDLPSNIEIMFKDADGNFVTVTEEVLQSLSTKEGLQYQVIDEDGHIGELQELQDINRIEKIIESNMDGCNRDGASNLTDVSTVNMEVGVNGHLMPSLIEGASLNLDGKCCVLGADGREYTLQEAAETWRKKLSIKTEQAEQFSPDMFFADLATSHANSNIENVAENLIRSAEIRFEAPEDLSLNKDSVASGVECRLEEDMELCD